MLAYCDRDNKLMRDVDGFVDPDDGSGGAQSVAHSNDSYIPIGTNKELVTVNKSCTIDGSQQTLRSGFAHARREDHHVSSKPPSRGRHVRG